MEFLVYLLKINTAVILFYCIYRLLFRQDTFFQWKRLALLSIVFISFVYPAIDLAKLLIVNPQLLPEIVIIQVYNLQEVVATGDVNTTVHLFPQAVLMIYFSVSTLLFVRMVFQIGTIAYKLYHTNKKVLFGQTVYENRGLKTPFSFFRWIALDSSRYSETELKEILLHETTHVTQMHSVDTLLAEVLCIFCWFNPFAWLLKTEIRMNLEFLCDRSVLTSGCGAEHYQFHLLRLSYYKATATITNNFNVPLLKKRIFMMNKKQTSHRSMWKYTLILPVVALLLVLNSSFRTATEKGNELNTILPENATAIQVLPQPENETIEVQQNPVPAQNKPVILESAEVMPQFPGGYVALAKFLKDNIIYPVKAMEQGIQGTVALRFVVKSDGSIGDVELRKNLDPAYDNEAIRVVKMMPKWTPGKEKGKPVDVYYTLPILFRLNSPN